MKGPKESYLPTLQALPGKVEFTYLPSNAQEALLLPVYNGANEAGNMQLYWVGIQPKALLRGILHGVRKLPLG